MNCPSCGSPIDVAAVEAADREAAGHVGAGDDPTPPHRPSAAVAPLEARLVRALEALVVDRLPGVGRENRAAEFRRRKEEGREALAAYAAAKAAK